MLTEAQGLPVGAAVTGANVPEVTQVQVVLDAMPVLPPPAQGDFAPGFCADKGYDAEAVRRLLAQRGYRVHILGRGEEPYARLPGPPLGGGAHPCLVQSLSPSTYSLGKARGQLRSPASLGLRQHRLAALPSIFRIDSKSWTAYCQA